VKLEFKNPINLWCNTTPPNRTSPKKVFKNLTIVSRINKRLSSSKREMHIRSLEILSKITEQKYCPILST